MSKSSLVYNGMLLVTNSLFPPAEGFLKMDTKSVFQDRMSSSQSSSKIEVYKSKIKTGEKFSDYTTQIKSSTILQ